MALVLMATHPWGTLWDDEGNVQIGQTATLTNRADATAATHYATAGGTGSSTGAMTSDSRGRLMRYVEEGSYNLTVNGETLPVEATAGATVVAAGAHVVRRFPIEAAYGPVLGAVRGTDVTASIIAARDAAVAAGGGVVTMAPTGNASRYKFMGAITFPDRVGFLGDGPRATVLEAQTAGSYLNFEGNGPLGGNFAITGNFVAEKNIVVGLNCEQRTFLPIRSENADVALLIDTAQNNTFIGFHGLSCERGIVFDNGAGGNVFLGHTEINGFSEWAVVFQHTGAYAAPFDYPVYNTFYTGMLEHVTPLRSVTGAASTNILTSTAHGFRDGQRVAFRTLTGGTGLSVGTPYYVVSSATNTFQVSTTLGGSAIDFTTDVTAATAALAINGVVLDEAAGQGNQFVQTFLSASSATAACALVESHDPGGFNDKKLRFDSCHFQGDVARAYVTAFDLQDGTNVELGGRCTFGDIFRRFFMEDTCQVRIENEPAVINGAGAYFTNNGGTAAAGALISWDNATDEGLPGLYTPTGPSWTAAAGLLVAGRGYFARFRIKRPMKVASIAYAVTVAATSNDNVEVALYDSVGARLATSGAVASKLNSAIVQSVPITATLEPGIYYAALLCPTVGGTAATVMMANIGNVLTLQLFGATAPNMLACQQAGLASLPNPIVPAFATASVPVLAVREI